MYNQKIWMHHKNLKQKRIIVVWKNVEAFMRIFEKVYIITDNKSTFKNWYDMP